MELKPDLQPFLIWYLWWTTHLPFLAKQYHLVDRKQLSQASALWMWEQISTNGQVSDHPAQHSHANFGISEIFVVVRSFLPPGYSKVWDEIFLMFFTKDGVCFPTIEDTPSTGKLSNMLPSQHDTKSKNHRETNYWRKITPKDLFPHDENDSPVPLTWPDRANSLSHIVSRRCPTSRHGWEMFQSRELLSEKARWAVS